MAFGENLKIARIKKKLTQQQVADMIGVSKSTITNYEADKREPDVFVIKKLAALLEVTGDYLIGFEPKGSCTTLSEEALRIARIYDNANDKIKAAFEAVAAITEA